MVDLTGQHLSHTKVISTKISLPTLVKTANASHISVDKLLCDNIQDLKTHLIEDVQKVFSNYDPDGIYVMPESANTVKKPIRIRKLKRTE